MSGGVTRIGPEYRKVVVELKLDDGTRESFIVARVNAWRYVPAQRARLVVTQTGRLYEGVVQQVYPLREDAGAPPPERGPA